MNLNSTFARISSILEEYKIKKFKLENGIIYFSIKDINYFIFPEDEDIIQCGIESIAGIDFPEHIFHNQIEIFDSNTVEDFIADCHYNPPTIYKKVWTALEKLEVQYEEEDELLKEIIITYFGL